MDQRISVVTLGVRDLSVSRRFYCEGLGWQASATSNESVVFIPVGSIVMALYPRALLAEDACIPDGGPGFGGVTLAHNVHSKEVVDRVLAEAVAAGAALFKPAQEVFWGGYSGYFGDPDGHPWEIVYNPHWGLTPEGRLILPA
jgi:uncharacterized protein